MIIINVNVMKRLMHVMVTALMLIVFSVTSFAAIRTGNAGPNVYYEFNDATGELRIYGTGDMYDSNGNWDYHITGTSPIADFKGQVRSVVIEEGVTSIGAAFFYQCTRLTSVSIPQSVRKISYEAFRGCSRLASINIPAGVTDVYDRSFTDCPSLSYISVDENSDTYVSVGGVLYTKDLKKIVRFPEALNVIDYVIPEGVIMAATDALYKLANVQSVTIPTSMSHIDYGSFDNSPKLTKLIFKSMTPPTFGKPKGEAIQVLKDIYIPCGASEAYAQSNWEGFTKASVTEKVLIDFEVHTNDPALGDVEPDFSQSVCGTESAKIIITAVPTTVGVFDHWQDGDTSNPRTVEVPATSAGKIEYTGYFVPKEFEVKLEKNLEALVDYSETREIGNDYFQLSIEHDGATKTTEGNGGSVTGRYHYGDEITLYCNVVADGYKFYRWSDNSTDNPRKYVVTKNVTLKAQLKVGNVTIKTVASGGSTYGTTTPERTTVSFGTDVTIKATPTANYLFARWDDGDTHAERVVTATVDKTYTAYFNVKTFKVSVDINDDAMGTVSGYGTFNAGTDVTLVATPKPGYDFVGWGGDKTGTATSLSINSLDKNYNITATFKPKEYTITFKADGKTLSSNKEKYNTMPTEPTVPAKASTAEYEYEFAGWSPEVEKVTKDATYTATYAPKKRSYTIKFVDGDGNVLQEGQWEYGTKPNYSGATPTKTPTAQYTYTYKDWDRRIEKVTKDATYTATFDQKTRKYKITFVDDNGTTILKATEEVAYGVLPTKPKDPTKAKDAQYTYTFAGWSPVVGVVNGDQTYTATYKSTLRQYDITFKDGDGNILQTISVDYGKTPSYTGKTTPTKSSTVQYNYTFNNTWSPVLGPVDGPQTYTAQFNQDLRKYTITFKNYDGTLLQESQVGYGETPVYSKAEPKKPADAKTTWKFIGWDTTIIPVDGPKEYTAQFVESDAVLYTITFKNPDGNVIGTKLYKYEEVPDFGGAPSYGPTVDKEYTFLKWDKDFAKVTKDDTYTAIYTSAARRYEITFVDDNGATVLQTKDVPYGTKPVYTGATPTKAATAEYTYTYNNVWTPEIVAVEGEATYKVVYQATKNKYKVTFVDYDDVTVFETQEVEYGSSATRPAKDPVRAGYTFTGWQGDYTRVTADVAIKATYEKNKYTVIFKNDDGTLLDKREYEYGEMPSYAGKPVKKATPEYTYDFDTWDKPIVAVVAEATYTATYKATKNTYDVYFYSEDGKELLQKLNIEYGVRPKYSGKTPVKAKTAEYTYEFSGWSPAIVDVVGEAKYYAKFASTVNEYDITFVDWDGSSLPNGTVRVKYGNTPVYSEVPTRPETAQTKYKFVGWNPEVQPVTSAATYKAVYSETTKKYTITFKDWDGRILQIGEVEYGMKPTYRSSAPVRASDEKYTYTYTGWTPTIANVTGDATYTAQYSKTAIVYTVTLLDYKDEVLSTMEVPAGEKLVVDLKPTRPDTKSHTYEFVGWDPAVTASTVVTSNMTLRPKYKDSLRKYKITFVDYDDKVLQSTEWEYGSTPSCPNPTRTGDAQYTYTFNGWEPRVSAVTGEATYKATFTNTTNVYDIVFVDYDGKQLLKKEVASNEEIECDLVPKREADVAKTYTFSGWDPQLTAGMKPTSDMKFTATYKETARKYKVRFLMDDGKTEIQSSEVEYNSMPSAPEKVEKKSTAQYTYTFTGWDKEIEKVAGNTDYTARFKSEVNTYRITFVDYNGEEIKHEDLKYGSTPSCAEPTRESDEQYSYSFSGWEPSIVDVKAEATYKATYKETTNKYLVTFKDEDGTVLKSDMYAYGTMPSCSDPAKKADAKYSYIFSGWDKEVVLVKGTETYTATYNSQLRQYVIVFKQGDKELQRSEVVYGGTPEYKGETPVKESDVELDYTFSGWSPAITPVEGEATYEAQFKSDPREYTITFVNYDNTELQKQQVAYGKLPEYTGAEPTKPSDGLNNYTFMFWMPELTYVTGDATYYATYSSSDILYTVTFRDYDGKVLLEKKFEPGQLLVGILTPVRPSDDKHSYEFAGWDPEFKDGMTVESDMSFTATYKETARKYKIRFVTEDGIEISSSDVEYGVVPEAPKEVVKESSAEYSYTFKSWDKEIVAVSSDATYTALFDATKRSYLIKFLDYDGRELQSSEMEYGVKPTCPEPTRNADAQYTYTFSGWDKQVEIVTDNATYTAQYSTDVKSYKITFVDYDDTILQQTDEEFGALPKYVGSTPERKSEGATHYTFKGWLPELGYVDGDATYKAIYSTADILYAVTFVDYDGTVLLTKKCEEGEKLTIDIIPQREGDEKATYEFAGWNPAFESGMAVESDLTFTAVYSETKKKYTVEVLSNNALFGTVVGSGEYEYGQEITIEANASEGCVFVKWDDETTGGKRQVVVTRDMTFTATFEVDNDVEKPQKPDEIDPESPCYYKAPAVALYDWLLMIDYNWFKSRNYNIQASDVTWYRIVDEQDDACDDNKEMNDDVVGTGFYYTMDNNLIGTGDYYAVLTTGDYTFRTKVFTYSASNKVLLLPTKASRGQVLHIKGLIGEAVINVYDINGRHVKTEKTDGSLTYEITAEDAAGIYIVHIYDGRETVVKYLVK